MSKDSSLSRKIHVHDIDNPPAVGRGINVSLALKNQKHLVIYNWESNSGQPSFTLKISDPKSLGLSDFEDHSVEKFMDKVLLACNLSMRSAVFTRHNSDSTNTLVDRGEQKRQESKSEVTKTSEGYKVEIIEENIAITDHVGIVIGFNEELDENEVLETLNKINKLEISSTQTSLNLSDLEKSVNEYAAGMSTFELLGKFKHLFSSMELATNCDGTDRSGIALDNEVSRLATSQVSIIEDCRRFNDRAKHINRNAQEESAYQEGLSKIASKVQSLREICQKIILQRLRNI